MDGIHKIKEEVNWIAKEAQLFNMDIPAKLKYIALPRLVTSLVSKRMGFSKDDEENIEIAISEACINTVLHAYKNSHNNMKRMHIRYLSYPEKLVIVIRDFGRGFDPYFVQQYVKRKDAEMPEKVGLGLFLIKTMMDEVEVDSSLPGGTQVRMTKYIKRRR